MDENVLQLRERQSSAPAFVPTPNQKGAIAELAIAAAAAKAGVDVLKPITGDARYDLVFEVGGRLARVQCKWARREGDVVLSVSPATG